MSLRESLKALLGAGRELNRGRKCSSSSMPLLWRHGVGAASPSQLPPPHKAQSPHPCRGAAASRGPRDGAAGEIQPGKGARGRTFGYAERARSIPTAPHLQPNFLQRGRPQATSSRAVAPSPAATPFPPSLQPRPGAPSLLPEGAAAVPARRWGGGSGGARGALPARGAARVAAAGAARQPRGERSGSAPGRQHSLHLQVISIGLEGG